MLNTINDIKQIALKNRVITVGSIIVCTLSMLFAILYHTPNVSIGDDQIEVFKVKKDAIVKQNHALQQLAEEQFKSTQFFAKRDSTLQIELRLNRNALEKLKLNNENYSRFNFYSANDWSRYFSNLPDSGQ